jgi:hypothetical protein
VGTGLLARCVLTQLATISPLESLGTSDTPDWTAISKWYPDTPEIKYAIDSEMTDVIGNIRTSSKKAQTYQKCPKNFNHEDGYRLKQAWLHLCPHLPFLKATHKSSATDMTARFQKSFPVTSLHSLLPHFLSVCR